MNYAINVYLHPTTNSLSFDGFKTLDEAVEDIVLGGGFENFTYLHTVDRDGNSLRIVPNMDELISDYAQSQQDDEAHSREIASPYLSGRT